MSARESSFDRLVVLPAARWVLLQAKGKAQGH